MYLPEKSKVATKLNVVDTTLSRGGKILSDVTW